jgi:hypothetical protein
VGRFNNTADDVTQPLEIKHANSGERITLDSSGFETSGDISVGGSVQNADEINFSNLSTDPRSITLGDVWFRSDKNLLLIESDNQIQKFDLSPAYPDLALTEGLVAWYRMENTNNDTTTVVDATNNLGVGSDQTAFTGTNNGASFQSSGCVRDAVSGANPSGAYSFDGVDDEIVASNDSLQQGQTNLTVCSWLRIDNYSNDFHRALSSHTSQAGLLFGVGDGGISEFEFALRDAGGNTGFTAFSLGTVSTTLTVGQLTHFAGTYDGSTFRLYQNGTEIASGSSSTSYEKLSSSTFNIGSSPGFGEHLNGIIDDVRIYNRTLSPSEINQIYANTEPQ